MNPQTLVSGQLYIVSAPSGAGKTSLVKALIATLNNVRVSVSHTTRPKRDSEVDGENYFFVTKEAFLELVGQSGFFEYAEVFGNLYGTSRSVVNDMLAQGQDVILEIDWQGAQQVRNAKSDAISIFIIPPSLQSLRERLQKRGQDASDVIQLRLAEATTEISHYHEYDYLVVNEDFDQALSDLTAIFRNQQLKLVRQQANEKQRLAELLSSPAD